MVNVQLHNEGDGLAGSIDESADNRPYQFTQTNDPDPVGNADHLEAIGARTITALHVKR